MTMMMRWLCGTLLLPGFCALAQTNALEQTQITLAVGGKSVLYHLPLTIAEQRGYFRQAGLNVRIVDFSGGTKALQALIGGSADVVSGAYEHTIKMQSKQQFITAFVLTSQTPQIVIAASRKNLPFWQQASDLKGKKIGISAPGSSTHMVASYWLAKQGIHPDEVVWIAVGTGSGAVEALRSGKIDAIAHTEPVISQLEKSQDINILADTRTPAGTQMLFGDTLPAGALYAKESFLKNNPTTVRALTQAMLQALRWLDEATPEQVAATVPKNYLAGDPALYQQAFRHIQPGYSRDGAFAPQSPVTALRALSAFDTSIHPESIDLSRTWTNDYVMEARKDGEQQ